MPTPALTDEQCREALRLADQYGGITAAANAEGIKRETLNHRIKVAKSRGLHLSSGAQNAMQRAGLNGMEAKGGWIHDYDDEGKKLGTTRWSAPEVKAEHIVEKFSAAFTSLKPVKPVIPPKKVMDDLLTLYPLFDMHLGMLAWGSETRAGDYDLNIASDDLHYAFAKVTAITPNSNEAILVIGGDMFHADDEYAQTPQSKHHLNVDGRHFKVLDTGIQLISSVIKTLLKKHSKLIIRVLRGNHDIHAHMVLTFALAERYRKEPRVEIEKDPHDLFMKQWGKCLISAHHGDKAKPDRLTHYISDVCPYWSDTRHRFCFTGHTHHDASKDIGPLKWESLRAFCPPDSYAAGMKFSTRRALQALTFHKTDGLILRALDPIERAA